MNESISYRFLVIKSAVLPFCISHVFEKIAGRVDVLSSKYPDIKCILLEDIYKDQPDMPPLFYLGPMACCFECFGKITPSILFKLNFNRWGATWNPRFVLFFDDNDINRRV